MDGTKCPNCGGQMVIQYILPDKYLICKYCGNQMMSDDNKSFSENHIQHLNYLESEKLKHKQLYDDKMLALKVCGVLVGILVILLTILNFIR